MSRHHGILAAFEKVCPALQTEFGEKSIPKRRIVAAVVAECGCSPEHVRPSDHCYNRMNAGIDLYEIDPLFLYVRKGFYRYVGRNYPFTGLVFRRAWDGSGQEEVFGERKDGKYIHPRWTYSDQWEKISQLCVKCRHWQDFMQCEAFPEGIPGEIFHGDVAHDKPYTGDRGIRFEPRI